MARSVRVSFVAPRKKKVVFDSKDGLFREDGMLR